VIPAFLCVDVEPDINDPPANQSPGWDGYDAVDGQLERLRRELVAVTGASTNFSWYFRMDPQMTALYPRSDHAASSNPDRIERLAALGDSFGLHVHPERWFDERGAWVDDYADRAWNLECIEHAVAAFTGFFGERPARHRYGGGYLDNDHIDLLERLGVLVDLTPERRYLTAARRRDPNLQRTSTAQRTGVIPDCTRVSTMAYRPSRTDALTGDDRRGRGLVMIPLTSARIPFGASPVRRGASRLKHPMTRAPWRVMYPHAAWPDGRAYWDRVASAVDSMARPHVAIGLRTSAPGTEAYENARRVLEALPSHPIASRLRFVDPVAAAPSLLTPAARAGLAWANAGVTREHPVR
jgi:peptidoglycan/xylan/chitin deacetylase (PgdA/CDA1 family)